MEHVTKAAAVTAATDAGEFTAIAAAYSLDRSGDVIVPGAFKGTIDRWRGSGKMIPLHWNHSGDAADIIGTIDPGSLKEIDGIGLKVSGRLDLEDSETAREAWRSMKNNAMSLSFGYLIVDATKSSDGVQELKELDLFEVSIVPAPANTDTRVLSMKRADDLAALTAELQEVKTRLDTLEKGLEDQEADETTKEPDVVRVVDPLRKQAETVALEVASGGLDLRERPPAPAPVEEPELVELDDLKKRTRESMLTVLSGGKLT